LDRPYRTHGSHGYDGYDGPRRHSYKYGRHWPYRFHGADGFHGPYRLDRTGRNSHEYGSYGRDWSNWYLRPNRTPGPYWSYRSQRLYRLYRSDRCSWNSGANWCDGLNR
jgi:hypothetical protein